ncbi:hypothetical protein GQF56_08570 [Rhodobacter sphaeroides]|jgi:hypothetical protein|uniref:Uncharacterized protein n=1 Tax=Cereibacter sphaeroides (strain ATCC 17023 / DSM 158 / JCM 6121 / CCUG 31486 / LMG 2827 / NBRC 12203 / NCIMB 8253 / ATH 2.4.1.) TaxID=272943 RepID=Q3J2S7_CERS4|nr:hypothetical protein [Cereibacter sphaeroides]ABA78907.1 hypothetical protein RSP_2753 [Cereibacter sphaeroides 2.4.1]AMJ47237.1 hypothetical protein APX01_06725 [Cereibacter sphaeroides]ANS33949.1 hypothetical protein A3858_06745 [Cereibacter sphaeroides]ATN62993.1 hypothetical protein A3857_06740 [Cereibacter sphaeroides]AXC61116.1 hypothetical protein DQL45_06970 [Cereibacter sphaeroides 2.4.1]
MLIDLEAARAARAADHKPVEPRQPEEPRGPSKRGTVTPQLATSFDAFIRWHPHLDPRLIAAELRAAMKVDATTAGAMARDRRAAVRAALAALGLAERRVEALSSEHWLCTRLHARAMRELERQEAEVRETAYRRALQQARYQFERELDARLAAIFAATEIGGGER